MTPKLVTEVIKVQTDPALAAKFFNWAGKQKGYRHDFACYNAFAYCLNRNNRFRAADQVPELMSAQGKQPTEKQFEILIRMHSDANRGLRVYYVYEKMKKFGVKPRVFLYNRIMDALVKTDHLDLAMSVYDDFKDDGLVEESVTFMILVKGLCKVGRVDEVLELLSRMRGQLCKPDVFAYTAMVRVLVAEGNLDGCLKIWEEMKMDRVEPDVMAYATLVTGLCKGKRVGEAHEIFKEMKEKGCLIDQSIFAALIQAFKVDGKMGAACDLLKDMMDSGYRADLSIYQYLIDGFCNLKLVDKARTIFQLSINEGLEPDFATVNPLLLCYVELKRMDEFHNLLLQMQDLAFCIVDNLPKFFSFMLQKEERVMAALEVFEYLKTKVICFSEIGEIQEACTVYNKIIEMSSVPSVSTYYSLVKGLCKIGEIDAGMMLIRECLANVTSGPIEFKFVLAILHVCKSNDANKVIEVINEMMQLGHPPNDVIYSAVISGMCKHGTVEEARKVFSHMRDRRLITEASLILYDDKFVEHMMKKTADLVLSGIKFFGLESKLKSKGCNLLST